MEDNGRSKGKLKTEELGFLHIMSVKPAFRSASRVSGKDTSCLTENKLAPLKLNQTDKPYFNAK